MNVSRRFCGAKLLFLEKKNKITGHFLSGNTLSPVPEYSRAAIPDRATVHSRESPPRSGIPG